ncbi:MAG: carboxypeptidase-like regulatory domain-containing protein [Bryobacteraceae bacterium]
MTLLVLVAGGARSQTGMGKIQGTVKDVTGALVPGATVTATHTATARQYRTTTNEVGFYLFPTVLNGNYSILVEAAGMEPFRGEFLLQAGATAVVDAVLRVGSTSAEVTVTADAAPRDHLAHAGSGHRPRTPGSVAHQRAHLPDLGGPDHARH